MVRALIKRAFTAEHKVLNIQGVKICYDLVSFIGNWSTQKLFGKEIFNQMDKSRMTYNNIIVIGNVWLPLVK
jgi:hypothetical protein